MTTRKQAYPRRELASIAVKSAVETPTRTQLPPMLFTRDGHGVYLGDIYRGGSAFLICSGPSLKTHDLSLLENRGITSIAVNNAATVVRTQWWCSVDDPGNFSEAIWYDPRILKCVPVAKMEQRFRVRNAANELVESKELVGDMPGVFGFRRNEQFDPARFLYEDTFNWGNHSRRIDALGHKGCRSVMLVAVRLLYFLGIRRIYLVGCDFKMEAGRQNYAFLQDRSPGSIRGNNNSYKILNARFQALLPYFHREGLEVFNCTPQSGLTAFPYVSFERAVAEATQRIPASINTEGMYDRKAREKHAAINGKVPPDVRLKKPEPPVIAQPPRRAVQWPPFTLALSVDEGSIQALAANWGRWTKIHPELGHAPRIIVHDARLNIRRSPLASWRTERQARFIPLVTRKESISRRNHDFWRAAGDASGTEWLLRLSPRALPNESAAWPLADWFAPDPSQRKPVLIAPAVPISVDTVRLQAWNLWAGVPIDQAGQITVNSVQSARFSRAVSASPCWLWTRTDWLRTVTAASTNGAPPIDDEYFLFHRAAINDDYVVSAAEPHFGWQAMPSRPLIARRG